MKVDYIEKEFVFKMNTRQGLLLLGVIEELVKNNGEAVFDDESINELKNMLELEQIKRPD